MREVRERARRLAEERLLDYLVPRQFSFGVQEKEDATKREELRKKLRSGELDDRTVEIEVKEKGIPLIGVAGPPGLEELENQLREMLSGLVPSQRKRRRVKVKEA